MDMETFYPNKSSTLAENYRKFGMSCHRAGQDIVIPQLIQPHTKALYHKFRRTHIPMREFDTIFTALTLEQHEPAKKISYTASKDYEQRRTERLGFSIDGGVSYHSLKFRGYFMYNPCGKECWSQRLYEALAVYTVPIMIADGGIQAFERFIDWRAFTIKIDLDTWVDIEHKLLDFRQKIRITSDDFRDNLYKCWSDLQYPLVNFTASIDLHDLRQTNTSWLEAATMQTNKNCMNAIASYYWKKSLAIEQVLPWLDFSELDGPIPYNAFRLLTLEIWCQTKGRSQSICQHPADYSARRSYF
jgi:hypothetical protein